MDNDDDVIILDNNEGATESSNVYCQLCSLKFDGLTAHERQAHYDQKHHVDDPKSDGDRRTARRPPVNPAPRGPSSSYSKLKGKYKERNSDSDFWIPAQSRPPPHNYTPGLIPLLKMALKYSHTHGNVHQAVLCYQETVLINVEGFDRRWGCGYRNFLMACAALMTQKMQPNYLDLLREPISPGVRNLQKWIEAAWREGYDTAGAGDFKNGLSETKEWIGTAELYTAFAFRGVPCKLVDFKFNDERSQGVEGMKKWIKDYFTSSSEAADPTDVTLRRSSPVRSTNKMPLILQHEGHSRTIVGYAVTKKNEMFLLQFNPSDSLPPQVRKTVLEWHSSPPGWEPFKKPALQIESFFTRTLKRKTSVSSMPSRLKRTRPSSRPTDGVIVVDGSEDEGTLDEAEGERDEDDVVVREDKKTKDGKSKEEGGCLDYEDFVKIFRLKNAALRHKEYQILFFPMDNPWTLEERKSHKVVTSIRSG